MQSSVPTLLWQKKERGRGPEKNGIKIVREIKEGTFKVNQSQHFQIIYTKDKDRNYVM